MNLFSHSILSLTRDFHTSTRPVEIAADTVSDRPRPLLPARAPSPKAAHCPRGEGAPHLEMSGELSHQPERPTASECLMRGYKRLALLLRDGTTLRCNLYSRAPRDQAECTSLFSPPPPLPAPLPPSRVSAGAALNSPLGQISPSWAPLLGKLELTQRLTTRWSITRMLENL